MTPFKSLIFTLLISTICLNGYAQTFTEDSLKTADKLEISYMAKIIVKEFESLLNVISNENITLTQTEMLIRNSMSAESPNQIFRNGEAIVEDDINPNHQDKSNHVDVSISRYLQDLDIFYKKSASPTINFSNIKSSAVGIKEYVFIQVYFESQFKGSHKEIPTAYIPTRRVAEVRADKEGKQWKTRIVSVVFFDGNQPFEEVDYQQYSVAMPEGSSGNSNIAGIDIDIESDSAILRSKMAEIEKKARQIEQEYLEKFEKEIEERKKRFEKERKASFTALVEVGEKAFKDQDYEQALTAFEEAQAVDPYQVDLLKRINQIKQLMDDKARMAKAQYEAALKFGRLYAQIRDYSQAIAHYVRADKMRPGVDSISQRIKTLDQRQIYLTHLQSQFTKNEPQSGIKVYSREMKKTGEDPDLLFARGKCYKDAGKSKQAVNDFTKAINMYADYRAAYLMRGEIYEGEEELGDAITDYGMALSIYRRDPELLIKRAGLHLKTQQTEKAVADYSAAIDLSPKTAQYYMDRGRILSNLKKFTDAITDFSQVVRLEPKRASAWYQRGLAYLALGEVTAASDDFAEARRQGLNQTSRDHIRRISTQFYQQGMDAYRSRQFQPAVDYFTQAIQVNPIYAGAWLARGDAFAAMEEFQKAANDYTEAGKIKPGMYQAWYQRGVARYELGFKEEAVKDFEKTVILNPDFHSAYIKSGDTQAELKQFEGALNAYDRFLQRKPEISGVQFKAGKLRVEAGQYSAALSNLSQAIKAQKNFAEAYYFRGMALSGMKRDKDAWKDFSAATKQKGGYARALYEMGNILVRGGKAKKAVPYYDQAIRYAPEFAKAHFERAQALYELRAFAWALDSYRQAIELNPDLYQSEVMIAMGFCHLHKFRAGEARAELEKAAQSNQEVSPRVQYGLAIVEVQEGKLDAALATLELALKTGKFSAAETKKDPLLSSLKKNKAFKSLLSRYGR